MQNTLHVKRQTLCKDTYLQQNFQKNTRGICFFFTLKKSVMCGRLLPLGQGSATFNAKIVIFAPFLLNKIHVEPQNIRCPNKDNTAYS